MLLEWKYHKGKYEYTILIGVGIIVQPVTRLRHDLM